MRSVALTMPRIVIGLFLALLATTRLASQTAPGKTPAAGGQATAKAQTASGAPPLASAAKPGKAANANPKAASCNVGRFPLYFQTDTATIASIAKILEKINPGVKVSPDSTQATMLDAEDVNSDPAKCKDSKSPDQSALKSQIEMALKILDQGDLPAASFNTTYLIQVKNLTADKVVQNLPFPTPPVHLMKIANDFLLPIPVEGGQTNSSTNEALTGQAPNIKHDLEALDDQYGRVMGGIKTPTTRREWAAWMSRHTIRLSILEPREVILAFDMLFQSKSFSLLPITTQHAISVIRIDAASASWRPAEALERSWLYESARQANKQAAAGGGLGTPPGADSKSGNSGSKTSINSDPERTMRLYHLREATKIADVINKIDSGTPLVQALDDDQIVILPPASGKPDRTEQIRGTIALLDLPRPQVSLQVWSYQISASQKEKDEGKRLNVANDSLEAALAKGMRAIEEDARQSGYFDPDFKDYLTGLYAECVNDDHYCLGYKNALQIPVQGDKNSPAKTSLEKLLLLLAAAKDEKIKSTICDMKANMQEGLPENPDFPKFFQQLDVWSDPSNLHLARAAILEFLFQYKLTIIYSEGLSPYDLQQTEHTLDNILSPLFGAFSQDTDEYIESVLNPMKRAIPLPEPACAKTDGTIYDPKPSKPDKKADKVANSKGIASVLFGRVGVTAISGTKATVSGKVVNYFDMTQPPTLADVLNNGSGSAGEGLATTLKDVMTPKQIEIAQFIANANTQPKVFAQVGKDTSLTITPVSLDDASAAELDVDFGVNDDGDPTTVNQSSSKTDMLDRVSEHKVTDHVRVESLKLFQISTFEMQLTHKSPPKCWAYSPFCVAWKAVFGSVPMLDNLFEITPRPQTKDNTSIAVVRAIVVPTAIDLALTVRFELDRINDPVMNTAIPLKSISQLNGNIFEFHKNLMRCMVQGPVAPATKCLDRRIKLSKIPEDYPRE
jgi:hypothetical protein